MWLCVQMDVSSSSKAKATARNVNARRRNNYTNQTGSSRRSSLHDKPTQASAEKRYAQLLHYTDAQQSATNRTSNTPARGYPSLSKCYMNTIVLKVYIASTNC
jgi:hypothetical protein